MFELTVFIKVKIDNLNEYSSEIPEIVKKEVNINKDVINIITDKKYLSISSF
jgi:septum formation topological specificity factor MinE